MRIAVVVPARDEASRLPACLESLTPFRGAGDPIVVVDNGSRDATGTIARARGFETVVEPRTGRGRAVAAGYRAVRNRAPWVLVIHADMVVAAGAREALDAALEKSPDGAFGALGHRIADNRMVFRALEAGNRLRAHAFGVPYGDQAQFFRVAALERAGGFPDLESGEDLLLALRLRRLGPVIYVDCPVAIPSRHWRGGVLRATLRNWITAARLIVSGEKRRGDA
jgi:glycosyltransferase involved in cell wall biosynthesis